MTRYRYCMEMEIVLTVFDSCIRSSDTVSMFALRPFHCKHASTSSHTCSTWRRPRWLAEVAPRRHTDGATAAAVLTALPGGAHSVSMRRTRCCSRVAGTRSSGPRRNLWSNACYAASGTSWPPGVRRSSVAVRRPRSSSR